MLRRLLLPLAALALPLVGCDDEEDPGATTPMALPGDSTRDMGAFSLDPPGAGGNGGVPDLPDMGAPPPADAGFMNPLPPVGGCDDGQTRPCPDSCGMQACAEGAWGACEPGVETCNDEDDDCDGEVDESFAGKGNGCTAQQNGCQVQGTRVCSADGTELVCDAPPAEPQAETCDGTDEDCDGEVDEDFPGQLCCTEDYHCPPADRCDAGACVARDGSGPTPPGQPGQPGFPQPGAVCAAAREMPAFGAFQGDNGFAAAEIAGSCGGFIGGEQVFWFELDAATRVRLDTEGSDADTVLYVQQACGDAFSELACDDDGGSGLASVVEFNARAGLRYYVVVDSAFLGGGGFVLNFRSADDLPPPPECERDFDCGLGEICQAGTCVPEAVGGCADDLDCRIGEICQAGACVADPGPAPGGQLACDRATELAAFGVIDGDSSAFGNSGAPSCQANATGPEQVFTFQLDADTEVEIETLNNDFDPILSVRTACAEAASEIACDDDGADPVFQSLVRFQARAGQRYFVVVDGYRGDEGEFQLRFEPVGGPPDPPEPPVEPGDPCMGLCDAGDTCVRGYCVPPPPAVCAGALPIEMLGRIEGRTGGGPNQINPSTAGCTTRSTANEAIYILVLDEDMDVTVDTEGSAYDTVLYMSARCERETHCNDDGAGIGLASRISWAAQARVPYYIVVDGFGDQTGDYVLNVQAQ